MFVKSSPSPIRFGMAPSDQNPSIEFRQRLNQSFQYSANNGYKPADYPLTNMLIFLLEQTELKNPHNNQSQSEVISELRSALKRTHGSSIGQQKAIATQKATVFYNYYEQNLGKDIRKLYNGILNLDDFKAELAALQKNGVLEKIKELPLPPVKTERSPSPVALLEAPPSEAIDTFERTQSTSSLVTEIPKTRPTHEQLRLMRIAQGKRLDKLDRFEIKLKDNIKGQDLAIKELINLLELAYVFPTLEFKERTQEGKPRIVALLAGSSGVGKTETIKILSKSFGNREIIWLKGGDFNDSSKNNKITGSAPGYEGNQDKIIADKIIEACAEAKKQGKEAPIILIDELDKAHSDFFTIWNNVFDEGMMSRNGYYDKDLKKHIPPVVVDFRGIDIFCTANFAQLALNDYLRGKETINENDIEKMTSLIQQDAYHSKHVGPDFWGRFSAIIPYRTLTKEAGDSITNNLLKRVKEEFAHDFGFNLTISPEVVPLLIGKGITEDLGCRKLKTTVLKNAHNTCMSMLRDMAKQPDRLPGDHNVRLSVIDGEISANIEQHS